MSRSTVLTGRIDARDRAHQRHRRDRAARPPCDPGAELDRILGDRLASIDSVDALERYDLTEYLRETGAIDLPAAERLRRLAVAVEMHAVRAWPELRTWCALERIYETALRLEPDASEVWASRAAAASWIMAQVDDAAIAGRLERAGRQAAHRAMELVPGDAHFPWVMGHLVYHTRAPGKTEEALAWFERALAIERDHASAHLYRAHCLHDLKRWGEAIDAYDDVPLDAVSGPRAWMVDYITGARADCRLHAGDREGALRSWTRSSNGRTPRILRTARRRHSSSNTEARQGAGEDHGVGAITMGTRAVEPAVRPRVVLTRARARSGS